MNFEENGSIGRIFEVDSIRNTSSLTILGDDGSQKNGRGSNFESMVFDNVQRR